MREMQAQNARDRRARQKNLIRDGKKPMRMPDNRFVGNKHLWSIDDKLTTDFTDTTQLREPEAVDEDQLMDTIRWKERNAFLTRKTWHANTGTARLDTDVRGDALAEKYGWFDLNEELQSEEALRPQEPVDPVVGPDDTVPIVGMDENHVRTVAETPGASRPLEGVDLE